MEQAHTTRARLPLRRRDAVLAAIGLAVALALAAAIGAGGATAAVADTVASVEECSSGARTLGNFGDRVYPDQGNGGYTSVHTDLHIVYDTAANLFLPGNHADLTIRTTQCLTDFSFDFERTAMSGSAAGPNMTVGAVAIDGEPVAFAFKQPTYPGNPNGPDDPDPRAHAISNQNPVSATNPFPPACSPQTSGNTQNGQQCPANKLVITPSEPIPAGTEITVTIDYTGRPGVHTDGDGSTEGWFRVNTAAAPNDGSFVTTEPVGSMAWMPLNNHPTAKPTYDIYDTVPAGKTAIGPGELVPAMPGAAFAPVAPTQVNPPDANFPGGSWLWHWHSPEPIASYLVTNTIGSYDLVARTGAAGVQYFQAQASGLTAARKAAIKAVLDQQEDITLWQERFAGPYPFSTNGVIVALPSVGFAEEMQTKITFGNGASSTPSVSTFHHEVFHQWFGDHVSSSSTRQTFWKEGWATVGEYLNTARTAANGAGGLGTPAGNAAFDNSLIARFNTNYGSTSGTAWTSAPSNPTVGNLFTTVSTYTRPGTAYLALRQILGASISRPASDRWIGVMKQISADFGGGSITQPELEIVFHEWLPNQSEGCHTKLDQFFRQWFDTAYPSPNNATNRPQITGPGLNGPDKFYDDAGLCPRADQTVDFGPLDGRRPGDPDFSVSATASSGLPVTFSASGQCTVTGTTVHVTGIGSCTITASQAGDGVWKPASASQTFPIHGPIVSNDAPDGEASVQYSDALSPALAVSASDTGSEGSTLVATATGLPSGLSLAISFTSADDVLPGTRSWTVAGAVTASPGPYPVSVTVTDDAGTSATTSFTIVVTQEDADATYTGDMLVFTPSGGSSGTVTLRAVVRDSAAVPGSGDTDPGDIRKATITFKEGAATLCGPFPAALIGWETTAGTAACTVTLGLGTHTVDVYVDGYYAGTGGGIVTVAEPSGSFVTGGGFRVLAAPGGSYKADPGSRMHFGFNVKYGKNMKNLQGQASIRFDRGGRRYEIKSTATDSLGIALKTAGGSACAGPPSGTCFGLADFRSKANLTDVTNPASPVPVFGNLSLQVTMTDRGNPGLDDTIGVTLWNGPTLVFSSEWTGAKTIEGLLHGGNLVVH